MVSRGSIDIHRPLLCLTEVAGLDGPAEPAEDGLHIAEVDHVARTLAHIRQTCNNPRGAQSEAVKL